MIIHKKEDRYSIF